MGNIILENGEYYWIKINFDWWVGLYEDGMFRIPTGEYVGMRRIFGIRKPLHH